MQTVQSGATDLLVSVIALGCMSLTAEKEKQGSATLHRVFISCINFYNTADICLKET
jgi:aryl-alcohol dehydrogenase-like predicted oxidoreductase